MLSTRAPSHDRLAEMADDIRQMVKPIHIAIRGRIYTHPCLLDALRAATQPGSSGTRGPERRPIPDSRPPIRLDPLDALAEIYVQLAGWLVRLHLPSPPEFRHGCEHRSCQVLFFAKIRGPLCARAGLERVDWHKAALHVLVGAAAVQAPSIADDLADQVNDWWRLAAVHTGWQAEDLRRLR